MDKKLNCKTIEMRDQNKTKLLDDQVTKEKMT
jgi:hypothetical protein